MNQLLRPDGVALSFAFPERQPQRRQNEIDVLPGLRVPGDDALREHVQDERDVHPTGPRAHVGEVGHPRVVRAGSGEVAVEEISRTDAVLGLDRGPGRFRARHTFEAQ